MKKFVTAFAAILLALVSVSSLCSCGAPEKSGGVEQYRFYDFEDYKRNFQQIRLFDFFGSVSQNFDPRYVMEGNASALLMPQGHAGGTARPFAVFPTYSKDYDYNFLDFTIYANFTGSFYNAGGKNVEMLIGLTTAIPTYTQNLDYAPKTVGERFVLRPGWNQITYVIEHDLLAMTADVTSIYGVYLAFENTGSFDLSDSPKIYADGFRLQKRTYKYSPKNPVTLRSDEEAGVWEIASFDKDWQKYAVWVDNYSYNDVVPDLSLVSAPGREGGALRIYTRPGTLDGYGWPWIYISEKLFQNQDFSRFKDTAEYEYYVKFDFYNNYAETGGLLYEFKSADGKNISERNYTVNAAPRVWETQEVKLSDIKIVERDADGNVIADESGAPVTYNFSERPGRLHFWYTGYAGVTDDRKEFFIDNVRIEKVSVSG